MSARQSTPRGGSRYQQSVERKAITIHIAYEGAVDEAKYFEELQDKVLKRYKGLLKIIPVNKSSTDAQPSKVYDDLSNYLEKNKINLNRKNSRDIAFLVIDKDRHFNDTHAKDNVAAIRSCRDKGIIVLCSNPCFELWLLCHYIDVSKKADSYKELAITNKKENGRTFMKKEVSYYRKGEPFSDLISKTNTALNNEYNLSIQAKNPNSDIPDELVSKVGKIYLTIKELGIELRI